MTERDLHIEREDFLTLAEEILDRGKRFSFTARGQSMVPFIREGDTVFIAPISETLGVGDVILIKTKDDVPVLHRVITSSPVGVVTKGDAVKEDDGFTPAQNVLGKVEHISGHGPALHLRYPFSYFIAKRNYFENIFRRFPVIKKTIKRILRIPEQP